MKIKLYTVSGAFIADVEVGGTDYPSLVRWGDRIFQRKQDPLEDVRGARNIAKLRAAEAIRCDYWEVSIPQTRSVVSV